MSTVNQQQYAPLYGLALPRIADLVALRHSAKRLHFFPKQQASAAGSGNYRSRFRGRGMDFDEVRPYQAGDDIRSIDWRVTARTTRPHTKLFSEERERPILIAVDIRRNMFFGSRKLKSLVASHIASTLAWAGIHRNDRVGGMVFSPQQQRDTRSRRSHHNVLRFINSLSDACLELLEPSTNSLSFTHLVESVRRSASPGSSVIIISDFYDIDSSHEQHLFKLAKHCDLSLIQVSDPLEKELPPPDVYTVTDGQQQWRLDARSTQLRSEFQQRQQHRQQSLTSLCNRLGVGLITIATNDDVLEKLIDNYGKKTSAARQ